MGIDRDDQNEPAEPTPPSRADAFNDRVVVPRFRVPALGRSPTGCRGHAA